MKAITASVILAGIASIALTVGKPAYAGCKNDQALWSAENEGTRFLLYTSDGLRGFSAITLEGWRENKLAWRSYAHVSFSNGWGTLYANFLNAHDVGDAQAIPPEGITAAEMEIIDEDVDGRAEWVVLTGLGREAHYAGGLKVVWFNGFEAAKDERISPPNAYKFLSCEADKAAAVSPPTTQSWDQVVGDVYGVPELCEPYTSFRRIVPVATPDGKMNDGLWWMDDKRLVGWEFECAISGRKQSSLNLQCMGEGTEWTEVRPYQELANGDRKVGDVVLAKCLSN